MSIFSSNYDWDNRKDDDPLSNLINEDTYSSTRTRPSNDRNLSADSRSRPTASEARSSSSFLDNFLNEEQPPISETRKSVKFDESTIQSSSRRSIDWLGLGNEESNNLASNKTEDDDDWLTSGLNRRQKKSTTQTSTDTSAAGKNETAIDSQGKTEKSNSLDKLEGELQQKNDGELTVLKAKVSILEIEKHHLTESIDKLNANHEQETKLLKQLHEQQLNLTKSILSDQETLIKDERDRRISDLQNQLDTMERYLNESRSKTNDRIKELENEWLNEVKRLKTIHETTVGRLIEHHEQDLDRLKKIKEREIETLQNFQTKFGNLDELLIKWQQNSESMENLHHKLTIEQDRLLNQRLTDIDLKDKQIENIEQKWSQLANNLKYERESSDQLKGLFIKTVDEQKQLIQREKEQLRNDRNEFENERKKFFDERRSIELELERGRELINQTQLDQRKQDEILNAKQTELNQQQIDSIKKENEWKVNYERERDRLNDLSKQLDKDQLKLANDLSELKRAQDALSAERTLFEQKKELFDKEKIKLENLAISIVKRSEELEELSETVNQDRKENERLFSESEKLKKEFDEKLKILEANLLDLKRRELHLERQSEIVHQEWQELQNEKLHILCSLCSSSLNQGAQKVDEFLNVVQSSNLYMNINENDRSLLVWQITGQEENAILEEETEFLKTLKR